MRKLSSRKCSSTTIDIFETWYDITDCKSNKTCSRYDDLPHDPQVWPVGRMPRPTHPAFSAGIELQYLGLGAATVH